MILAKENTLRQPECVLFYAKPVDAKTEKICFGCNIQ